AKALQEVADFHVVEVCNARSALKSRAHLAGIILEALQRAELRRVDDRTIAHNANLRVAFEHAVHYVASSDGTCALYAERIPYFGAAQIGFLDDGLKQAFHG